MRAMVSWSGGKESALALYRAQQAGHRPVCLLNCVDAAGERAMSHGVPAALIAAQAEALGLPISQPRVTWESYEERFKSALLEIKRQHGIEAGVFGNIDVAEHRQWVERICRETGIEPLLPLWGAEREALLEELLLLGFKAIIVNALSEPLGPAWIGRQLGTVSLEELRKRPVDLCGEKGEYHTLVIDGPIFASAIVLQHATITEHGDRFFLEIAKFTLKLKVEE